MNLLKGVFSPTPQIATKIFLYIVPSSSLAKVHNKLKEESAFHNA
jgi:hypothetical protein